MRVAVLADAASVHTQRWVRALVARRIDLAIWSERAWPEAPVPVHPIAARGRQIWRQAGLVGEAVRGYRPDVVHAHYVSRYGLYAALAGLAPRVLSVWGADVEVFPEAHGGLNRYLLRWIFRHADAVTASSRYLAEVTARYTRKTVSVIPFGIDRDRFVAAPPNNGPLRWIINKALEPVYGIDWLLPLWAEIEGPWHGRILGDGAQRDQLARWIDQHHLGDRIELMGRINPEDLPVQLAWADVGLYPSRRESFGVAPLEMQAVGRAVVANRLGGLPEVVSEGVSGWLIDPGDREGWAACLREAVKNPGMVRERGTEGPAFVRAAYDFERNVDAMLNVYERVQQH